MCDSLDLYTVHFPGEYYFDWSIDPLGLIVRANAQAFPFDDDAVARDKSRESER